MQTSAEPGFEMAQAIVLSPSQIGTWLKGRRLWAFQYILKIKSPETVGQARGTDVHEQTERHLWGEGFDFSTEYRKESAEIAMLGVHLLPRPRTPGMRIEGYPVEGTRPKTSARDPNRDFRFPIGEGGRTIIYRGRMDVTVPDSAAVPGLWGGAPACVDHKSSSNIAEYALRAEDLHTDPQGVIYAYYLMCLYRSPIADLQWNYLPTRGPKVAEPRRLRVYSPRVVEEFQKLHAHGLEISATYRSVTNPLDLPPCNEHAGSGNKKLDPCMAYGGCPFKDRCTDVFDRMGFPINRQQVQGGFSMNAPNGTPQGFATMAALQGIPCPPGADPAQFAAFLTTPQGAVWASQQAPVAPPPVQPWTPPVAVAEPIPAWALSPVPYTGTQQPAPYGAMPAQTGPINPVEFQPPPTLEQRSADALAPTATEEKKTRNRRTNAEIAAAAPGTGEMLALVRDIAASLAKLSGRSQ